MTRAVIVDAVRSPMGKGKSGGGLSHLHPADLLGQVLRHLVDRSQLDAGLVDDVVIGCVGGNGEQAGTPGRQAVLSAGFPVHVPSVTVERKCGSGQQAVDFAVQGVIAGAYEIAIAGGVESMSRVPMGSAYGDADPFGEGVRNRFPTLVPQGISAELVARKWALSRSELDDYSARSHERASAVDFSGEIVPVGGLDADETIRTGTTTEKLSGLKAVFGTDERRAQFPDLEWTVTAGNASQITDGAAALLVMSEDRAKELGLRPRARIVASAVVGDDPLLMLTGPIPATEKVLKKAGLTLADIDTFEVNEAFASVPLAWAKELGVSEDVLNPVGGAIALGHPLGASGARIMTTMINHLERTGGRYGLQTMCEAGGMANATIIEIPR
ncbi:thiolase family protein [Rhodococcus sp. BP-252]|uniref:Acetyl-CoA acetyltransferase n=1 Tax=Rhodococcoides kyotonense TaxID=398843 RepID=A0A177YLI5_9NOCA|nr:MULTISPECIES: thiolase family protein [Rhodococcus]MBY6412631.1 thiolase family protein [Rhodococcus sp. BP-320]MBY6417114.1 thiolase family protein [Rhodococcus sp. BP-321]MBY6423202.1 thiolase family protein [Rhodococcus sp. BP-324]MBY6427138.1 thiolase family protein [Rhodococcus sp. BP-323]MBY6432249.1 thiolase family protein [Rhodococcus sp. BP-322]